MSKSDDISTVNPQINTSKNRLNGYTYDNAGNTTKDAQSRKFTYDGENKQTKVETLNSSGTPISTIGEYFYDGDGKRVKKYVPSTGETTIFVYNASGQLVAEYATQTSATPQVNYLTSDHLGSPRINTDANGAVISRHDYQPFGEEIARASYGNDEVRKQFTSYERDSETNLDHAKTRMYGYGFGRFTSPDDFLNDTHVSDPQSWNLYVYVRNNPLRLIDPSGEIVLNSDGTVKFDADKNGKIYTQTYDIKITGKDASGKTVTTNLTITSKQVRGTIYADDGTKIEAFKSAEPLSVKVTDDAGKTQYEGDIAGLDKAAGGQTIVSGFNNTTDCHGNSFANGEVWINNNQVEKLMKGDGYDVNNPSSTPTVGAVGVFSTDGTLATAQHSVTVLSPGDPQIGRAGYVQQATDPSVESKGGITPRVVTTPADSWTNTDPSRQNDKLQYYTKKVKN